MPRKIVECKAGLSQNLLQPRHGQHSNVIPPKSPHTSQVAKKKQENFCARLPSHLLVFWAGSLPTFWQSPARPAATQPVQRELAHKSLAKMCKANPGRTGGANFEVMVTSTSTWPSQNQAVRSQKNNVEMLDQGA